MGSCFVVFLFKSFKRCFLPYCDKKKNFTPYKYNKRCCKCLTFPFFLVLSILVGFWRAVCVLGELIWRREVFYVSGFITKPPCLD